MCDHAQITIVIAAVTVVTAIGIEFLTRIEMERNYFVKFEVNETRDLKGIKLRIQGHPFCRAPVNLAHVAITEEGDSLCVHNFTEGQPMQAIRLAFGPWVPLDFTLDVPSYIDRVVFGQKHVEIWHRSGQESFASGNDTR